MKTVAQCLSVFSYLLLIMPCASAQNARSAVSITGSDANPCTTVSPCRSFGTAIAHTNVGGEVIAIDSGGYGPFTIASSISIIGAPGIHAALTVTSGEGIVINAGASDSIVVRGLNITLTGTSSYGLDAHTFGSLSIENCTVQGIGLPGYAGFSMVGSATSFVTVIDSVVRDSSNAFIFYCPGALIRSVAENNSGTGLWIQGTSSYTVAVSAVDYAGVANNVGVQLWGSPPQLSFVSFDRALISNSTSDGIQAINSGATARVTNSTITDNGGFGFDMMNNGIIKSMKNNMVEGNASGDSNLAVSSLAGK